jgi:hypothetical protein
MGYVNTKIEPTGSYNRYLSHMITTICLASYASELDELVTLPEILCGIEACNRTPTVKYKGLTLLIRFFCQPHTPQLLFVLGGKEVDGLLVIILQF